MRIWILLGLCALITNMMGQHNHVFFEENTLHRSHVNPAAINELKFSISVGAQFDAYTNGVNYHDIFILREDGKRVFNEDTFIDKIEDDIAINADIAIRFVDVYYRIGSIGFSGGIGRRYLGGGVLPKGVAELYFKGNAPFVGQEINFQPRFNGQMFNEFYAGLHFTLGSVKGAIRGKWLQGRAAGLIEGGDLTLSTSDDIYQLSFSGQSTLHLADKASGNHGLGLDLGLRYDVGNTELYFSVMDLGSIHFEHNTTNYSVNSESTFEGLDLINYLKEDVELNLQDTLESFIGYKESNIKFETPLQSKINMGVIQKINDKSALGILFNAKYFNNRLESILAMHYNIQLLKVLKTGILYSLREDSYDNIGFLLLGSLGRIKTYLSTNDILGLFSNDHKDQLSISFGVSYQI